MSGKAEHRNIVCVETIITEDMHGKSDLNKVCAESRVLSVVARDTYNAETVLFKGHCNTVESVSKLISGVSHPSVIQSVP